MSCNTILWFTIKVQTLVGRFLNVCEFVNKNISEASFKNKYMIRKFEITKLISKMYSYNIYYDIRLGFHVKLKFTTLDKMIPFRIEMLTVYYPTIL